MANNYLRGVLGFKGERGFSAYDIAVQKGYEGTEEEWLATIGATAVNEFYNNTFKVLTGTMTINEAKEVPYPTGFNQTNCVAIALRGGNSQSVMGINYEPSDIVLFYEDSGSSGEVNYIVVLMKIS